MNPTKTTPDPQEPLNANTVWIKPVSRSPEVAEAKLQNKKIDAYRIIGECG
jgi:hypothetical protein